MIETNSEIADLKNALKCAKTPTSPIVDIEDVAKDLRSALGVKAMPKTQRKNASKLKS